MFSVNRLVRELSITPEQAKTARAVLDATLKRGEPSQWEQDSPPYELEHDKPSRKLYILNRLLDGYHGVEILRSIHDTMHEFNGVSYLNTGDPYASTLMFDHGKGRWILGCWGDLVERQPKRFE